MKNKIDFFNPQVLGSLRMINPECPRVDVDKVWVVQGQKEDSLRTNRGAGKKWGKGTRWLLSVGIRAGWLGCRGQDASGYAALTNAP